MNRLNNSRRSVLTATIAGVGCILLMLSSCVKTNTASVLQQTALLTVIQASPDEPPLSFFINGQAMTQNPLSYGSGLNYFSVITGQTLTGTFYQASNFTPVASGQLNISANTAYSLFLDSTAANPGMLLLTDSLVKPASGKAGIRFVNLSPDAPAVDLVIQGGQTITSNKSFKGHTGFLPVTVPSGAIFQVVKAGTTTVLATYSAGTITANNLYTLIFEGLNTPLNSTDQLSIDVITNAYF